MAPAVVVKKFPNIVSKMIKANKANASPLADVPCGFEVDGNAVSDGGEDWGTLIAGGGTAVAFSGLIHEDVSNLDDQFTQGSKDIDLISGWRWSNAPVGDKVDILDAGAALYLCQGQSFLYFFADRFAQNGDAQVGFWFFLDTISKNSDGTFSGQHTVGDLLVLTDFTQGGVTGTIKVYEWVGSGGSDGTLNLIATGANCNPPTPGATVCGALNSTDITAPWPYTPKTGTPGTIPIGGFFEGCVNLTTALPAGVNFCTSSFLAETRQSQSVTAALGDFALGSFSTKPQVSE